MKSKNKNYLKALLTSLLVIFLAVGGWYIKEGLDSNATKVPVSDPSFSDGTDRETSTTPERTGGILDTSGNEEANNESSKDMGVSSESGVITVFEPTPNDVIENGSVIRGESETNTVSYRLIDDDIGVVARGTLNVVKGKFSGQFSFSSNGAEGRLDIFNTLENGQEVDVIEIPVRFK